MNGKKLVACVVTAALLTPFAVARTKKLAFSKVPVENPAQYAAFSRRMPEAGMALHALDRLTFGPRPDDLELVNQLGLEKWLDFQLHPEKIRENLLLAQKLEPYESLRMSIRDTYVHYPQPQLVAAVARGTQPLPDDPELREVVQHLVDRHLRKKAQTDNGGPATAASVPRLVAQDDNADLEPKVSLHQILSPRQIDALQNGKPEEKRAVLASIPESRALDFAYALKPMQRRQLMPLAPPVLERKLLLATAPPQVILQDLTSGKIFRAAYSSRQLEEEMVDFWFNHFNVYFGKGADRFMLPAYEREAIRPYALGKFHDLLLATAKSPAMLFYLDNAESVAPDLDQRVPRPAAQSKRVKRGLNENYGRELMELHTLGANGGYTQKDVVEVARCFTGWTISPLRKGGGFEFKENVHDKGRKVVLGHVIPAGGGMEDGLKVLEILARSPQTAHHISLELAQRFVADEPPPSLVNGMAKSYLRSDGDIREVLKTMILSPEFFSEGAYHAKVKSPFEMIVSAVRAANADINNPIGLGQQIAQLGEPLYRKVEPTGYSSANSEWISSAALLSRMNFALAFANNKIPGVRVDQSLWERLGHDDPLNIARTLLNSNPDKQTAAAIEKALTNQDVRDQLAQSARVQAPQLPSLVAGVDLGSPEFQRR